MKCWRKQPSHVCRETSRFTRIIVPLMAEVQRLFTQFNGSVCVSVFRRTAGEMNEVRTAPEPANRETLLNSAVMLYDHVGLSQSRYHCNLCTIMFKLYMIIY